MHEMHLGLPGFTHSSSEQFAKTKKEYKKLKKQKIHDIFIKKS